MQLTDRHVIKKTHPNWAECDQLAFSSKNLFNYANYQIRQSFIWQGKFIPYATLASEIKESEPYRSLPSKVAQQTLKRLDESWRSFFAALTEWKENPSKFFGRPKLPKYKDKEKGRSVVTYTTQAISIKWFLIPTYHPKEANQYKFSGKRIKRGLYRTGKGCLVNADVNGSLNILRIAFPCIVRGDKGFRS